MSILPWTQRVSYPRALSVREALARLSVCEELRDVEAAARTLEALSASEGGQWLLRQVGAAMLREAAASVAVGEMPQLGRRGAA